MATDYCCGCIMEADYGTSTTSGTGSVTDPFTVTLIDPAFVRPLVRVKRTITQPTVPDNTSTAIPFDTEIFDTDNMWQTATPTRLTINTAGLYLMGGCALWPGSATGVRELSFRINGVTEIESQDLRPNHTGSLPQSLSYLWPLQVGEYVELVARQESGVSMNLIAAGNYSIVFWMAYVGKRV